MKRIISILLILTLAMPVYAFALSFTDVPSDSWAKNDIIEAYAAGIMEGRGGSIFGYGDNILRSEFATMLTRLMGWQPGDKNTSYFDDVPAEQWYTAYANALFEHEVETARNFRPGDHITRREMAVMLVKALGYTKLANTVTDNAFDDVTEDAGYISVAHTLGIINGTGGDNFDPEGNATREQGAAMMMRLHRKYYSKLDEIHGFYAISSWDQRDIAKTMDAVSFGWARLEFDGAAKLNQTSAGGNDWRIPNGYEDALILMREGGAKINLAVTMTDQEHCKAILADENNRKDAIDQIISAAKELDGVTIDFEGMKGEELKNGLNSFASELKTALDGKLLYIAVHPVLKNSSTYFDAYDYRTLGEVCDKVILMAHDYAANTLPSNLLNTDFIATPVSPFDEVYTALRAITDEDTGVSDRSKIILGISTPSTAAWNTENKRITDGTAIHPSLETVEKRLAQADTEIVYSDTYRNPYAWYTTENGQQILLWYEDARSVADKIGLAKMFGINDISLWRIGAIPDGSADTYMNVWQTIDGMR